MNDPISYGFAARDFYTSNGLGDPACEVTTATDIIADQLRALFPDQWYAVLRSAVMHAHEEIHGWGSAENLTLDIDGLEIRNAA
ncbi:hypothetical protein [Nonomuraea candida]|uniref:hypothetical protein n=1 Tax=Nonomuraea candida TaxID=359159 RepID=UPI0005BC34BA|nr:hypothetical protein [Nonomuraea candida]